MKLINTIRRSTILRYLIAGGGSYAIEFSVLVGLKMAGASNVKAVAISYWVGLIVGFILQKIVAFQDKSKNTKRVAKQVFLYMALVGFNYVFAVVFTSWFATFTNVYIARTVALLITMCLNFYMYKTHVFGNKKRKKDLDPFDPNPLVK